MKSQTQHSTYERLMVAAINLGLTNLGQTAPNPSVGALIVDEAQGCKVLSTGVTGEGGRPHAEVQAIQKIGTKARGKTVIVSLEPCSHFGKNPPCADAIIDAGIKRVIYALKDPNPRVAGHGIKKLQRAGCEVIGPVLPELAYKAHLGHILSVTQGRPAVHVKIAHDANGIYAIKGHEARITGAECKRHTFWLRSIHDTVLVGRETFEIDKPQLTCRLDGMEKFSPRRIVLTRDPSFQVPECSGFISLSPNPDETKMNMPYDGTLSGALKALNDHGTRELFIEAGATLATALFKEGLIDRLTIYKASNTLPISKNAQGLKIPEWVNRLYQEPEKMGLMLEESFALGQDHAYTYTKL